MKRTIKIIALCLCLSALTALFAGCDYLDEMQASHAVLSDDQETISFNGETYKLLPEDGRFYCAHTYTYYQKVDVTNSDVPVLLKNIFCYNATYYEKSDIFNVWINEDNDPTYYSKTFDRYYCNEKDYDKYIKAIEENELDRIGFEYEYSDKNYNYFMNLEIATEEVSKEILDHIIYPKAMKREIFNEVSDRYDTECLQYNFYKCDSEGILAEIMNGFDIYRDSEGNAYLMNFTTAVGVKLSDTVADALKDEYFYGDYSGQYYEEFDGEYSDDDIYFVENEVIAEDVAVF